MSWDQFLIAYDEWWGSITFIVAALFVIGYGFGSPWYKTPFGRSLLTLDFGLAVALFPTFLDAVFHVNLLENRVMAVCVVIAGSMVTLAIAYRLTLLWSIQHRKMWRALKNGRADDNGHKPD